MKITQRLTGLALAMLLTLTMLGGIDGLAHNEFAAAAAQTLAHTAAPASAARV